jgi:acyl-CoA dehydrogenase
VGAAADGAFQWERLLMALGAVGAMQAAFERTLRFARERAAAGRPGGGRPAVRHRLAQIATTIEAGRDVFEVMDTCLQLQADAGCMPEPWVTRAVRDARLGPIGGGTDEIMREVLGRSLGL